MPNVAKPIEISEMISPDFPPSVPAKLETHKQYNGAATHSLIHSLLNTYPRANETVCNM